MRGKLFAVFLFLIGFAMLSHAQNSIVVNLGDAVKHEDGTGVYYTFPNVNVDAAAGVLIKSIKLNFKQGTATYSLPSGWVSKPISYYVPYTQIFENESGVSASDVQNFLKSIKYTFEAQYKGGELSVEVCNYIYPMEPMAPQSYDISTRAAAVDEEFCGYVSTRFGFESTKSASVNGVANNGTSAMPVKVILGDEIEYRINAVNAAPEFYGGGEFVATRTDNVQLRQGEYAPHELSTIVIEDVLPEGVELVGSPDNNGVFDANTRTIRWELMNVPRGENRTVTFKVKLKVPLIAAYYQNVMENKATVTTKWVDMMLTRGEVEVATRNMELDGMNEYVSVTNSTYHQRSVCTVKFVVDPAAGGNLNNGADQLIDYGTNPAAGVTVTPSGTSYKFKGWKHGGFTSLKPGDAAVPATSGPAGDANWYTTVDVKGDVTFTAEME